jgi:transcription elongation factor Elf1
MGKKSRGKRVIAKRRVIQIPKYFPCPFCAKDDSIRISLDRKKKIGLLECRSCGIMDDSFRLTPLTEPIDIYTEWRDAALNANKKYNPRYEAAQAELEASSDGGDAPVEFDTRGHLQRDAHNSSGSDSSQLDSEMETD